jgi:hypothetical protein
MLLGISQLHKNKINPSPKALKPQWHKNNSNPSPKAMKPQLHRPMALTVTPFEFDLEMKRLQRSKDLAKRNVRTYRDSQSTEIPIIRYTDVKSQSVSEQFWQDLGSSSNCHVAQHLGGVHVISMESSTHSTVLHVVIKGQCIYRRDCGSSPRVTARTDETHVDKYKTCLFHVTPDVKHVTTNNVDMAQYKLVDCIHQHSAFLPPGTEERQSVQYPHGAIDIHISRLPNDPTGQYSVLIISKPLVKPVLDTPVKSEPASIP